MDLALTIINGQSDNSFINTNLFSSVFQGAVELVKENLQQFTNSPNFTTQMESVFGEELDFTTWETAWLQRNIANFPTIQIVSIASLNGALGAFSRDTNQIYLAAEYLNSATTSSLTGLLLEEYGHYVDAQLNAVESIGDEGEIFSALVQGKTANPNAYTQDDTTTIALNGQTITIEQGSPIIFVKQDAIGTGDGFSWGNAYRDLQTAIANAPFGSEIWVARGTYLPTTNGDRNTSFQLRNGVEIYGGFVGNEISREQRNIPANLTVLSGDLGAVGNRLDNSYTVVTARNITSATVLDGFTITGGNEGTESGRSQRSGAGVYIDQADITLTNLIITDNIATTNGGGIYINAGTPRVTNTTLRGNRASAGGGLYNNNSSPFLNGVYFISNSSSRTGGGIQNVSSSPILLNVGLIGNVASSNGGGIYNSRSSPGIYNVLFNNNSASREGGGIANVDSSPSVVNASFYGNTAQTGGAITSANINSKATVINSIFFANQATVDPQINNKNQATTTVSYSIVQGGYPGYYSANIDPLFVNPANGDFRLQPLSFAINAGINAPTIANNIGIDLNGNPRISNGIVDMGAYELNVSLDPLQYGASNKDLIAIFGYNLEAFNQHYFSYGRYEGRNPDSFDEYRYIASNRDLITVYGLNGTVATEHYLRYGYGEGRLVSSFDPTQYLASNKDLIPVYGYDNLTGATSHYIQYGVNEQRSIDSFDELRYIASSDDLIRAYGYNPQGGTEHYVRYGYNEPRNPLLFNPAIYLASNPDLIRFANQNFSNPDGSLRDYKAVLEFGSQHFIVNGLREGRSRGNFEPIAYLNRSGNEDLRAVFGNNLEAVTRHYLEFGFEEGRTWM